MSAVSSPQPPITGGEGGGGRVRRPLEGVGGGMRRRLTFQTKRKFSFAVSHANHKVVLSHKLCKSVAVLLIKFDLGF